MARMKRKRVTKKEKNEKKSKLTNVDQKKKNNGEEDEENKQAKEEEEEEEEEEDEAVQKEDEAVQKEDEAVQKEDEAVQKEDEEEIEGWIAEQGKINTVNKLYEEGKINTVNKLYEEGKITTGSSDICNPFDGDGTTGEGVFLHASVHAGDVIGAYASDTKLITTDEFDMMMTSGHSMGYYMVQVTIRGNVYYLNAKNSKCWTGKINHAWDVNEAKNVHVGANAALTTDGMVMMLHDIEMMPGDKVELKLNYGYDYWWSKLVKDKRQRLERVIDELISDDDKWKMVFDANLEYCEETAEHNQMMSTFLDCIVPNNIVTLDGHQQVKYAQYWSGRDDEKKL